MPAFLSQCASIRHDFSNQHRIWVNVCGEYGIRLELQNPYREFDTIHPVEAVDDYGMQKSDCALHDGKTAISWQSTALLPYLECKLDGETVKGFALYQADRSISLETGDGRTIPLFDPNANPNQQMSGLKESH